MIYFIAKPDRSAIKIGTTLQLPDRLKQLTAIHGEELEVLAVADGSQPEEKSLHQRFAHLRMVGEWFSPGDDLMAFIASDGKPWDGNDRDDKSIRIEKTIASKVRTIARHTGRSAAEVLSDAARANVNRLYIEVITEMLEAPSGSTRPPKKGKEKTP